MKVINRRGADACEEVPVVWEPIIEPELFEQVQQALKENRPGRRTRSTSRYRYLFSGLIRCGLCGQKLSGASAESSTGVTYRYYSHHGPCPKDGPARHGAEIVHRLVLGWLRDIAENGERFAWLKTEASTRMRRLLEELRKEMHRLDRNTAEIDAQTQVRITELTRADVELVRATIESSIARLAEEKLDAETRRQYLKHEIAEVRQLLADPDALRSYRDTIRIALPAFGAAPEAANPATSVADTHPLQALFAHLTLYPDHIETALSRGSVTGTVGASSVCVGSPPDRRRRRRGRVLAVGVIDLPEMPWMLTAGELRVLYLSHGLTTRQIARLARVSHSTIVEQLRRHRIVQSRRQTSRPRYLSLLAALLA